MRLPLALLPALAAGYTISAAAHRPKIAVHHDHHLYPCRHRPPLACSTEPPKEQLGSVSATAVEGSSVGDWVRQNVLQGVEPGPATYAIMTVYFVQGVLGLATLARTYFMKDQLGLSAAESSALLGITTLPWVIKPVCTPCSPHNTQHTQQCTLTKPTIRLCLTHPLPPDHWRRRLPDGWASHIWLPTQALPHPCRSARLICLDGPRYSRPHTHRSCGSVHDRITRRGCV